MGRRKRRTNRSLKNALAGTNTKRHNAAEGTTVRNSATSRHAEATDNVSAKAGEIAKQPNCEFAVAANTQCFADIHAITREIEEKSQEYDHDFTLNNSDAQIIPSINEHTNYFLLGCNNTVDAGLPVLQSKENFPHPLSRGESSKKMDSSGCVSYDRTSSLENIPESKAVLYPFQKHYTDGLSAPLLMDGASCVGSVVGVATSNEYLHNHINKDLENGKTCLPLEISENTSTDSKSGGLMLEDKNNCELVGNSNNSPHDLKTDSENSSVSSLDIVSIPQEINPVPTEIDVDELECLIKRDWKISTDAENINHPPPVNLHETNIVGIGFVSDGNRNTETPKTSGSVKIPRVKIFPDSQSNNVTAQRSNLQGIQRDDLSSDEEREILASADHSETMAFQFCHELSRALNSLIEEMKVGGHSEDKRKYKTSETSVSRGRPQSTDCSSKNANIDIPVLNFLDLPEEPECLSPGTRELLGILSTTSVDMQIPSLKKC